MKTPRPSIAGSLDLTELGAFIMGVKPINSSKGVKPVVELGQELCTNWARGSQVAQLSC